MDLLIIEPNKLLAEQYIAKFHSEGLSAAYCVTAEDAINIIEEKNPKIILLELFLKQHGGLEFLYELRSYPEWLKIPVIINSRVRRDDVGIDMSSMNALGVRAYLYKPDTSLSKLSEIVKFYMPVKS